MTHRSLFLCAVLLLVLAQFALAGRYQRTKDRQIRVWNEHPERWDEAVWTGERDESGYATGKGILTWYQIARTTEIGSFIPSSRGHDLQVVRSFSGRMMQGRFDGEVVTSDPNGRKFHAKYAAGTRTGPWTSASETKEAPAEAPKPAVAAASPSQPQPPAEAPANVANRGAIVEAPTQDSHTLEVFRPPTTLRSSSVAATVPDSAPVDSTSKDPAITDFKRQTETVLSRVGQATNNFHEIEKLDSVQPLSAPISESIHSLADRAREARSKTNDQVTIRNESETTDALSLVNDTTRTLAAKDAMGANSKLNQFLKNHPAPPSDSQRALWHYLTSTRSLCDRQQRQADAHLQRAQSLVAAGRAGEAVQEYKQANLLFPSPMIAEKIQQLSSQSGSIDHADR